MFPRTRVAGMGRPLQESGKRSAHRMVGAGFVDCARCDSPAAEAALAARRETFATRAEAVKWIDDTWNEGRSGEPDVLRKIETEHFQVVWEMEGMKVGRKRLSPHEIGGTDQVIQAAATVSRAVRTGEADALCAEVLERLGDDTDDGGPRLEVVSERYDTVAWFGGDETPVERTVHASCGADP